VRHALFIPNFGVFSDIRWHGELAARAENAGWDGWFVWDHVVYADGNEPAVDPWLALAVAAQATTRVRLGPLVTPLPRRRPWNVARQAAGLDRLSEGRAVLGVGLGTLGTPEFASFGEQEDPRHRAAMLDEGLDLIADLWSGRQVDHAGQHYRVTGIQFLPRPLQDPLPVWVAAIWPARRPLRRAARWQGVVPLALPGPGALAEIIEIVGPGKDIVVAADRNPFQAWEEAGATWLLHRLDPGQSKAEITSLVARGPRQSDAGTSR
jgi:alkanesulfonate monooxygenase SsuD/methylene tetrahydromethanopterin reductase-like flavin-dependent oxidoreductase (luciferase family)